MKKSHISSPFQTVSDDTSPPVWLIIAAMCAFAILIVVVVCIMI